MARASPPRRYCPASAVGVMQPFDHGGDSLPEELVAFGLDWHLTGGGAFDSLLNRAIPAGSARDTSPAVGWRGASRGGCRRGRPTIFCIFPPPEPAMKTPGARLVWIPMWDHARIYGQAWWNSLSPDLRVVAFSQSLFAAGPRLPDVQTLELAYFMDTGPGAARELDGGRASCGRIGTEPGCWHPRAVEGFCRALSDFKAPLPEWLRSQDLGTRALHAAPEARATPRSYRSSHVVARSTSR